MTLPKQTSKKEQPSWRPPAAHFQGLVWAEFVCPNGHEGSIMRSRHQISADGKVFPSVLCPHHPDCAFHEILTLENWPTT